MAHLGADKVLDRIRRDMWHPYLYKEVNRVVRNCPSCRENQIMRHKPWGLAQPVLSPPIPFHTVSMDFVTGLPLSEGFDAMTTVTDKFTKTLRVYPCKTTDDARTTADRFFKEVYRSHGLPRAIISDRDVRFTSKFWETLCAKLGIERKMTTSYNPQADGQAEKSNQTVEIALRHFVDYNQESWTSYLPQIEFAINTSINDTTKCSPYKLLYGIEPRDALSEIVGAEVSTSPSAEERTDYINCIRKLASNAIAFAQARQARYYDMRHEAKEFKVGDDVMLSLRDFRVPGIQGNKIGPKRIGPFKVLKRHGKLAYELELPAAYRIHPVVNIAKLEPASPDSHRHSRPPPLISEEGVDEYEVNRILDQRYVRNRLQYLIDWKGYPPEERTWEPAADVEKNAPKVIQAWRSRPTGDRDSSQTIRHSDNPSSMHRFPIIPEQSDFAQNETSYSRAGRTLRPSRWLRAED